MDTGALHDFVLSHYYIIIKHNNKSGIVLIHMVNVRASTNHYMNPNKAWFTRINFAVYLNISLYVPEYIMVSTRTDHGHGMHYNK